MAEEEKLGHKTGVEKIKQEDAGKQGAIGSEEQKPQAPAEGEDIKIGNKEKE